MSEPIEITSQEAGAALARIFGPAHGSVDIAWHWNTEANNGRGELTKVVLTPGPIAEGVGFSADLIAGAQARHGDISGMPIPALTAEARATLRAEEDA